MITVPSKSVLDVLVNHEEGEKAFVEQEHKIYEYTNGAWQEFIPEDGNLGVTVYQLNQQIIQQMPNLDADGIQNGINVIDQFTHPYCAYMLLCRDINYYTVFITGNEESNETVGQATIDCFSGMDAELKAVDLTDDGNAVEIWFILPNEGAIPLCAYLFNYDEGVILCR